MTYNGKEDGNEKEDGREEEDVVNLQLVPAEVAARPSKE